MLTWTPKMWHMRAQRRHAKTYINIQSLKPTEQNHENSEPLVLDYIKHKRHFSNTAKSNGLRAYFGYN